MRLPNPVTPMQIGAAAALTSIGVGAVWAAIALRRQEEDPAWLDTVQTTYWSPAPEGAGALEPCTGPGPCVRSSSVPTVGDGPDVPAKPTSESWQTRRFEYSEKFKLWSTKKNVSLPDMPQIPTPGIPWLGPVVATSVNFLKSLIKKKKNYVSGGAGYAEVLTTRPFVGVTVQAVIEWGHYLGSNNEAFPCARRELWGTRVTTGELAGSPPESIMPSPGLGKWDSDKVTFCEYARTGGDPFNFEHRTWVPSIGPQLPEIGVVVQGGQTDIVLWLPGRGGEWWYDVTYRVLPA